MAGTSTRSFTGFPPTTLSYLRDLGANNSKAWFDAHRATYERDYLAPALGFIEAMHEPLLTLHSDVRAEPRINGSLFRINRDVRFSRDKTPYKDHIDSFFWLGEGRSRERPGFFFRLRHDRLTLGAGIRGFDGRMLNAYRAAVLDDASGTELESVIEEATSAGASVDGVGYKNTPAGLDPNHPRAGLLLHNALHASFDEPIPASLSSPAFADYCLTRFQPLTRLAAWVAAL